MEGITIYTFDSLEIRTRNGNDAAIDAASDTIELNAQDVALILGIEAPPARDWFDVPDACRACKLCQNPELAERFYVWIIEKLSIDPYGSRAAEQVKDDSSQSIN